MRTSNALRVAFAALITTGFVVWARELRSLTTIFAASPSEPSPSPSPATADAASPQPNTAAPLPPASGCHRGGYTQGRWVYDTAYGANYTYDGIGKLIGSCGVYHKENELPPREPRNWRWQPDDCPGYLAYNKAAFCAALRGRNIIFVGDSINEYWHFAILNGLGKLQDYDTSKKQRVKPLKHAICKEFYPAGKEPILQFVTNQHLLFSAIHRVNRKWWQFLPNTGILVINSGAWMVKPMPRGAKGAPVSDAEYARNIKAAATFLKQNYTGEIVYRTTHIGHPECWKYDKPLEEPIPTPYHSNYTVFRWEAIPGRNAVAKEAFRDIGAKIMDIEPMMALRPDGHIAMFHPKNFYRKDGKYLRANSFYDCLHYCSPGPMDSWTEMLMNVLRGTIT